MVIQLAYRGIKPLFRASYIAIYLLRWKSCLTRLVCGHCDLEGVLLHWEVLQSQQTLSKSQFGDVCNVIRIGLCFRPYELGTGRRVASVSTL